MTGLPHGYGVFIESNWVHCCCVANGAFAEGKRVSVDKQSSEIRLVSTKFQVCGPKLEIVSSLPLMAAAADST